MPLLYKKKGGLSLCKREMIPILHPLPPNPTKHSLCYALSELFNSEAIFINSALVVKVLLQSPDLMWVRVEDLTAQVAPVFTTTE